MLHFYLDPKDLDIYLKALDNLTKTAIFVEHDNPKRNARAFATLLQMNFLNQKYASQVAPLKKRYKAWKAKFFPGTQSKKGMLTSTLANSVTSFKMSANVYYGGINTKIPNAWNNSPTGKYGYSFEYGYKPNKQPERPFIRLTRNEYSNSKLIFLGRRDLRKIRQQWK